MRPRKADRDLTLSLSHWVPAVPVVATIGADKMQTDRHTYKETESERERERACVRVGCRMRERAISSSYMWMNPWRSPTSTSYM